MKLSEGKLFTIEALNRIEGFEWPEWAQLAQFDTGSKIAIFNSYIDGKAAHMHGVNISQDCGGAGCLVSVTKDEFESIDGWVRNDGSEPAIYGNFDLLLDDGEILDSSELDVDGWDWTIPCNNGNTISHWRYHKQPQNQAEQPTQQLDTGIESLISQHKSARLSTLEARRQLEQAEAAEHNLLLSIEAWAESNGFDIRLLDESEEKPELVITDWRDLRVGDVIECVIPDGGAIECGDLGIVSGFDDCSVIADFADQCGYQYKATSLGTCFKFIRRPVK